MPRPLDVDREAIRTLAVAVGLSEAAKQSGVPYDTIRQWSCRGNWFAPTTLPVTMQKQPVTGVTSPAVALQNVMLERKDKGRLHLSKYYVNASAKAAKAKGNLEIAPLVRHVTAIGTALWPEQTTPGVSINILNSSGGMG